MHPQPHLEITSFTDAIAMAFGIRRRFAHAHSAAMVNHAGRVVDLTVFSRPENTVDTALGWAGCFAANDGTVTRMVLFSAVAESVAHEPRAKDVELLRGARARFADMGLLVVDWLQCDGHVARSIDVASDGEGWRLAVAVARRPRLGARSFSTPAPAPSRLSCAYCGCSAVDARSSMAVA